MPSKMIQPDLFHSFEPATFTVTQINQYLRQLLESDPILQKVWVKGEVSNLSTPRSGHIYFTLKDDNATINCVIWRSTAERLKILPDNGLAVEVRGYVSVYEQGGRYQLYVDMVRTSGEGTLFQRFLLLKEQLEEEGLFDESRKRPLPPYPQKIGIVTSATGAAVQDMFNTLMQRYPLAEVILAPAAVQGEAAPMEIVRALYVLNQVIKPDVILVGRGGGSLEDLWCFNDERVVRAIAASTIPVISGVGHETDFTLSDFVADRRAPTPTGAAVMAVPDIHDMLDQLNVLWGRLHGTLAVIYEQSANRYEELANHLKLVSPISRLKNAIQHLDDLERRLGVGISTTITHKSLTFKAYRTQLQSLNPNSILNRGYALVRNHNGVIIRNVHQVSINEEANILLKNGTLTTIITGITNDQEDNHGENEISS